MQHLATRCAQWYKEVEPTVSVQLSSLLFESIPLTSASMVEVINSQLIHVASRVFVIANGGRKISLKAYQSLGRLTSERLEDLLHKDGRTIIFEGIHEFFPELKEFVDTFSNNLQKFVNVNAYLSRSGSHGFAKHYDTHDVVIFHLEGKKRWVFNGFVDGAQTRIEVLKPGDCMYIPEGMYHDPTVVEGCHSLHLTIGITEYWRVVQKTNSWLF